MSNEPIKYYRTVFQLTVLSDREISDATDFEDLSAVAEGCRGGDFSGKVDVVDVQELGKRSMALQLIEQGSDPDFLLGEEGWKYGLDIGDEVTWTDPDDGLCTRTLKIRTIRYRTNDIIFITDTDGGELECFLRELS